MNPPSPPTRPCAAWAESAARPWVNSPGYALRTVLGVTRCAMRCSWCQTLVAVLCATHRATHAAYVTLGLLPSCVPVCSFTFLQRFHSRADHFAKSLSGAQGEDRGSRVLSPLLSTKSRLYVEQCSVCMLLEASLRGGKDSAEWAGPRHGAPLPQNAIVIGIRSVAWRPIGGVLLLTHQVGSVISMKSSAQTAQCAAYRFARFCECKFAAEHRIPVTAGTTYLYVETLPTFFVRI